jgi:YD repeat-containing protein
VIKTFEVVPEKPSGSAPWFSADRIRSSYSFPDTDGGTGAIRETATDGHMFTCDDLITGSSNLSKSGECGRGYSPACGLEAYVFLSACDDVERTNRSANGQIPPGPTAVCTNQPMPGYSCRYQPKTPAVGKPVNIGSGEVMLDLPLFSLGNPVGTFDFAMHYHSAQPVYSTLAQETGYGWTHPFTETIRRVAGTDDFLHHIAGDGAEAIYRKSGTDTWVPFRPAGLVTTIAVSGGNYRLQSPDGSSRSFHPTTGRLLAITDRWGNAITGQYDANGNLTAIVDPFGRTVQTVETNGFLTQIVLPGGATWNFGYSGGQLTDIRDPLHPTTGPAWRSFTYAANRAGVPRLLTEMRDDASVIETHTYDTEDRAITSTAGPGREEITIEYTAPRRITHKIDATRTQVTTIDVGVVDSRWVAGTVTGEGCATCSGGAPGDTLSYNTRGEVTERVSATGARTQYTYDTNGNVLTITEAFGTPLARTTTNVYGMTSWPSFQTSETVPGPFGNRVSTSSWSTDERTLTETTTGRLISGGATAAYSTITTFDARHRITQIDGPRTDVADVETRTYYPDDDPDLIRRGRLQSVTAAAGLTTTYDNYDIFGNARRIVDPNGVVTTVVTDARGRGTTTTSEAVAGDANETAAYTSGNAWDSRDRMTRTTTPRGTATAYEYEPGTDRLTDTIALDASGNQHERLHVTLNPLGWKLAEEAQSCATPAPVCTSWITKRSESFEYDDNGNLTDVIHADGTRVRYSYDAAFRLTGVQDERHAAPNTVYEYDVLDRLTKVTQTLAGAPGGTIATSYTYNVQDQLTSVTDPNGNVTTYEYDDFGRMIRQVSPVSGTTTYSYDAAGNLTSTTDANGAATARTYDAANRPLTASSTRGGTSESLS